ncbi:PIG-L family deacetylase [Cellulomonas hominis]
MHAHPDDETLATGALLATWARAGLPVTVVTCTRGERGEVIGAELAHLEGDGPALARHRETELAAAMVALGVRDQVFLDRVGDPGGPGADGLGADGPRFRDSGMAWAEPGRAGRLAALPDGAFVGVPLDDAAGRLARLLRDRRPGVVATYEPHGGYGHPDHVRAHEVTMRAVQLAADPTWEPREPSTPGTPSTPSTADAWAVPVVLWAATGEQALRAGYRALATHPDVDRLRRGTHLVVPDPDGPLPSVAVADALVDVEVDVQPVLGAVLDALRAHGTQVTAVTRLDGDGPLLGCYALSNDVLAPLLTIEGYRLAPGAAPADVRWPAGALARAHG